MHKLYIKNMVCQRCNLVVAGEIKKLGIDPISVRLGEVDLENPLTAAQSDELNRSFAELGFEILDDPNRKTIEKIKKTLLQKIQSMEIEEHFSLRDTLVKAVGKEYTAMSKLFSQVEGITIEQFFISQKIEKVKELLFYNQLSLSEIAWKLGYSSVPHLSTQFRKITGLTPTRMRAMSDYRRKPLDRL